MKKEVVFDETLIDMYIDWNSKNYDFECAFELLVYNFFFFFIFYELICIKSIQNNEDNDSM